MCFEAMPPTHKHTQASHPITAPYPPLPPPPPVGAAAGATACRAPCGTTTLGPPSLSRTCMDRTPSCWLWSRVRAGPSHCSNAADAHNLHCRRKLPSLPSRCPCCAPAADGSAWGMLLLNSNAMDIVPQADRLRCVRWGPVLRCCWTLCFAVWCGQCYAWCYAGRRVAVHDRAVVGEWVSVSNGVGKCGESREAALKNRPPTLRPPQLARDGRRAGPVPAGWAHAARRAGPAHRGGGPPRHAALLGARLPPVQVW